MAHHPPPASLELAPKAKNEEDLSASITEEVIEKGTSSYTEESRGPDALINPIAERRLLRKLDYTLLPLFILIYCLNFIDRTAIGNAKIAGTLSTLQGMILTKLTGGEGLEKDLGMKGFDFNIALTIFYVSYILADIPSTIIMKQVGPIWVPILIICFGVVTLGTAFIHTYGELIATRVLLGVFEAGTLPTLVYMLTRYYRRKELVIRTGIFFGVAPALSGAFGGLLASGLLAIPDFGIVTSWRKIFFVEGMITTTVGLVLLVFMPGDPLTTKFLTESERELTISRLNADAIVKTQGKAERTSLKLVLRSFNIWTAVCSLGFILINVSFQGLSLFLPTVVNSRKSYSVGHYTVVQAQLRTVPPFAAALVWNLVLVFWSSYSKQRATPIILSLVIQAVGYSMALGTRNPHARYAAAFLSLVGSEPIGPLFLIWGTDNAAPDTMRAVTAATITGVGSIGAVIAVWTYLPKDSPNFHKGNSINLGAACIAIALSVLGSIYIRWENAKRDRGERDHRLVNKTEEEIRNLGYRHPKFRYQI